MKSIIQPVKGTRDFYPAEMSVRNWLYQQIANVSNSFGYQEYEGPILERLDLYAAKSGEELVKEQSFVFPDRGGEQLALRPELTPTLARMIAQKQGELAFPVRWWSYGPFWRYERPQKGRTREFFQWNIDLLGVDSPEADAELIAIAASFFKNVGLTSKEIQIYVNNRRLMDSALADLEIPAQNRKNVFQIIDKRDKLHPDAWSNYAQEKGLTIIQIEKLSNLLSDKELWRESEELVRVFDTLDAMGLRDFVVFDPQVIRGLEYYTGTVFEGRDAAGEGRAVFGGGRYDNLVGDVGGDPLPGVGFAMGDVMVSLLLQKYGKIPAEVKEQNSVLMTVFDQEMLSTSFAIANNLRANGFSVVTYPESVKLQKQLKFADRCGIRFVLIQGPDEAAKRSITIKDLKSREQILVNEVDLAEKLRSLMV